MAFEKKTPETKLRAIRSRAHELRNMMKQFTDQQDPSVRIVYDTEIADAWEALDHTLVRFANKVGDYVKRDP